MSRFSDEPVDEGMVASEAGNDDDAERQMDGQRAVELLGEMDEMYQAPLALFYLQQHSYKEIAEILDVPIGTVMSRLHRGRKGLQKRLYNFASERGLLPNEPAEVGASTDES